MVLFWRLLLAHVIADFPLQTDAVFAIKKEKRWGVFLHGTIFGLVAILLARRWGIRLVYSVHNLNPHEQPYPAWAGLVNRFIFRIAIERAKSHSDRVGNFQLQFSLHTTDPILRRQIIPVDSWSMAEIADYGREFYSPGDRKITLNFALAKGSPLEPSTLKQHFHPDLFLIKITPLNPTYRAQQNNLSSHIDPASNDERIDLVDKIRNAGYTVILSIGEQEENKIGSNCGQYLKAHVDSESEMEEGYTYPIRPLEE